MTAATYIDREGDGYPIVLAADGSLPLEQTPGAVNSILSRYAEATEEERTAGRTWYADAQAEARRLAENGPSGFGIVRGAAVIAVLSANQGWSANVASARRAVRAAVEGREVAPACRTLGDSSRKAARILAGEQPGQVVSGRKVRQFWRAICGDPNAVAIDRWAIRAAGYPDSLSDAQHDGVRRAYLAAAELVPDNARDLQAIVWVQIRGSAS